MLKKIFHAKPRQEIVMGAQFSVRNAREKKAYAFLRIVFTHDDDDIQCESEG